MGQLNGSGHSVGGIDATRACHQEVSIKPAFAIQQM